MNIRRAALIFVAVIISASCSEKSVPDRERNADEAAHEPRQSEVERAEDELQPPDDQISEDCVAFVRSTKVVPAGAASADCPGCPVRGTDALSFRHVKTDQVSCSGDTCNVLVTIRAVFNPGSGQTFAGGLTAWIPPEQRAAYLSGQTPSGEQTYRVKITYKRRGEEWRAVEFDRAPVKTASSETPAPIASGIEGTIVVSPTRPGPIKKDEPRAPAPVRNTQFVVKTGEVTVATFTTDGEGRFRVALPPGHYIIAKEGAPPRVGRWRFEVDVVAGQMSKVNWTADSGMR